MCCYFKLVFLQTYTLSMSKRGNFGSITKDNNGECRKLCTVCGENGRGSHRLFWNDLCVSWQALPEPLELPLTPPAQIAKERWRGVRGRGGGVWRLPHIWTNVCSCVRARSLLRCELSRHWRKWRRTTGKGVTWFDHAKAEIFEIFSETLGDVTAANVSSRRAA